jgi:hypothetical protein
MPRARSNFNVKAIRALRTCAICQKIGIYQPEHTLPIPLVVCIHSSETQPYTVPKKQRTYCHPRCYIDSFTARKSDGVAKLLTLHTNELEHIRIGDVPMPTVKRILKELERRRIDPLDEVCPKCGAIPGETCRELGRNITVHSSRVRKAVGRWRRK